MDFGFDWGGSGGFQTRGKKKKTPTAKFDALPSGDSNEGNGDGTSANGSGAGDGLGGSGGGNAGDAGGGGGDDNNGGGGGGDDDWGFSKKGKKKNKKQQQEEEERKKKEEAAAAAAAAADAAYANADATSTAAPDANSLSWANDPDDPSANDDWAMGWGTMKAKDKKKKKVCVFRCIWLHPNINLNGNRILIFHLLLLIPRQVFKTSTLMTLSLKLTSA